MFEILPVNRKNILAFRASGRLTDADYREFLPRLEGLIRESGPLSLYVELEDFHGWEAQAAWDDLRFGLAHDRDFRRIAIVGDRSWEHSAIALANLFVRTRIRFFDRDEAGAAWAWLEEKPAQPRPPEALQPYRKLLLATDFSLHSEYAAGRALQIAAQSGAQLEVLHVVEEPITYYEDRDPVLADIPLRDEPLKLQAMESMNRFAARTGLDKGATLQVQWGIPVHYIVSRAREQAVDLIIMGSHGQHGIERLLGSVSNSVLHRAPCDVLIVKS
jgi:nucleotide-binding universal stress UspA family protein